MTGEQPGIDELSGIAEAGHTDVCVKEMSNAELGQPAGTVTSNRAVAAVPGGAACGVTGPTARMTGCVGPVAGAAMVVGAARAAIVKYATETPENLVHQRARICIFNNPAPECRKPTECTRLKDGGYRQFGSKVSILATTAAVSSPAWPRLATSGFASSALVRSASVGWPGPASARQVAVSRS